MVWAAAALGTIATSPGQSFSISLFTDHFIQDLSLDRTTVSGLYGLGTFTASLALLWVGKQIDRRGNRLMSAVIAGAFALVLLACSLISGPIGLLLAFVAIRGLGQGALGLVSSTAVAQWFQKRRGQVLSLSLVLFALFQRVYLPWLQHLIDTQGWRQAWLVLGGTVGLVVLPVLWVFLRDRPESFGLHPDGRDLPPAANDTEVNWMLGQAMRAPIFWAFLSARVLSAALGTALIFHQVSIFASLGHSPAKAAEVFGYSALFTAAFTLLSGRLVDSIPPKYVVAIQMFGLAAATGIALLMTEGWLLVAYSIATGIFMGSGSVFDGTVWVNVFGRAHQGAIRGFVASASVAGTAVGPIAFGFAFDHLGGYPPALWLGISLALMALVANLLIRIPVRVR